MGDKLLPCPFCGGEAFRRPTMRQFGNPAECRECGAVGPDPLIPVSWNTRRALPAAPAEDVRAGADVAEDEDDKYLILKRGMYYRPNRRGYTSSPAEAGRYTLAQAVFISHPNGPDGPRDGMSFVPVAALTETPADGGSNG